jgi:hypothetical protein
MLTEDEDEGKDDDEDETSSHPKIALLQKLWLDDVVCKEIADSTMDLSELEVDLWCQGRGASRACLQQMIPQEPAYL